MVRSVCKYSDKYRYNKYISEERYNEKYIKFDDQEIPDLQSQLRTHWNIYGTNANA